MPTLSPLDRLHHEYAALAASSPNRLTPEINRSLAYFRYETGQERNIHPTGRMVAWFDRLNRLEGFVESEGRMPRDNNRASAPPISAEERELATWVRTERTATQLGRRSDYQLKRLGCVPGYRENPLEDQWNAQFVAYERMLDNLGRPPLLRSNDAAEGRLAAWAAKQRLSYRRGTLTARRQRMLRSLTTWTWGRHRP